MKSVISILTFLLISCSSNKYVGLEHNLNQNGVINSKHDNNLSSIFLPTLNSNNFSQYENKYCENINHLFLNNFAFFEKYKSYVNRFNFVQTQNLREQYFLPGSMDEALFKDPFEYYELLKTSYINNELSVQILFYIDKVDDEFCITGISLKERNGEEIKSEGYISYDGKVLSVR